MQAAEKALTKYPKRWLLWPAFFGLLGIDDAAIYDLLLGQGMENPQRAIVATAGACIFFYLTHMASKGART